MIFGDTSAGVWLMEMVNNCLREKKRGRSGVDIILMIHMCKEEPKNAQIAMQLLVHELKKQLEGKGVAEAEGDAQTTRLLIGSLLIAYSVSRGFPDLSPPELEPIMRMHPVIIECADYVAADNQQTTASLYTNLSSQLNRRKPWWKFW